jgi:hypothetical protein
MTSFESGTSGCLPPLNRIGRIEAAKIQSGGVQKELDRSNLRKPLAKQVFRARLDRLFPHAS